MSEGPKRLFDKNERSTPEGCEVANIACTQGIGAAFKFAELNGFSFRDASNIIMAEVSMLESAHVLGIKL